MGAFSNRSASLFYALSFLALGIVVFQATRTGMLPLLAGLPFAVFIIVLCYRHPDTAFLALVVISLFVSPDVSLEAGIRIGPTRMFIAAFLLACLLRKIAHTEILPNTSGPKPLFTGLVCYIAAALVSATLSTDVGISLKDVIGRQVIEQFLVFYLFVAFFRLPHFRSRLKSVLYVCTLLLCLIALVEEVMRFHPLVEMFRSWDYSYRFGFMRVRATFFHPLAFASFLLLIAPFVISDFFRSAAGSTQRLRYGLFFLLIAIAMFLTISRLPWILLLFEVSIFVFWVNRHNIAKLFFAAIFSLLLLATAVLGYEALPQAQKLFSIKLTHNVHTMSEEAGSAYYRWRIMEAVAKKLATADSRTKRMLFGFGPNTFFYAGLQTAADLPLTAPDLHYARILYEFGIIGTSLFVILLVRALFYACRGISRARDPSAELTALACFSALFCFIVENTTVSMFNEYPLGMLFWMTTALALETAGRSGHGEIKRAHHDPNL